MLLNINPEKEVKNISSFLKKTLKKQGFSDIVVALSGGIDSAVTITLAVKALGKNHVHALMLPYGDLNKKGEENARKLIDNLKIPLKNIHTIPITKIVDWASITLNISKLKSQVDIIRRGNLMARSRMMVLFDFAKKHKLLVLGTENKSEYYLSYFTRFGDEASDIEIIRHLYKTQVFKLANYLGIPEQIINTQPTAGLWKDQTDEKEFGFTYKQADQIIYYLYEKKETIKKVVKKGFARKLILKIKSWVDSKWFKHELPLVFKN